MAISERRFNKGKPYEEEFKQRAMKMALASSIALAERELGVRAITLRKWLRDAGLFPPARKNLAK